MDSRMEACDGVANVSLLSECSKSPSFSTSRHQQGCRHHIVCADRRGLLLQLDSQSRMAKNFLLMTLISQSIWTATRSSL